MLRVAAVPNYHKENHTLTWTYVRWYLDGKPLYRNVPKRLAKKWMKSGRLVMRESYPVEIPEADPSIPTGELITVVAVHGSTVTIKRGEPIND